MVKRLYKNGDNYSCTDDRHEILNLYASQCAYCKHFHADDYYCSAYPDGIPDELLRGTQKHNSPIKGQVCDTVYERDKNGSIQTMEDKLMEYGNY